MEDSANTKVQSPASVNAGKSSAKLLRYPLRSSVKSKEENHPVADSANSSVSKRGRPPSNVSKSVAALDFSGKEKSSKPPRRLSVPSKSSASPVPRSVGNITPISEARVKRSAANQGKSNTPVSDVSVSSGRKKFCVLSSSSYWLSQIKLSESASKHKISLGFFKLALEAGCEPLQKMRDELKSYVSRYDLSELGESVKELFESYKISDNFEQLQASVIAPHVPEAGNQSDDDVHSSTSSITDAEKLKLNPSDTDADEIHGVQESNKETSKKIEPVNNKIKRTVNKDVTNSKSSLEVRGSNSTRNNNPKKPKKQELAKDQDKLKRQGKKSTAGEDPIPSSSENTLQVQENKENLDVPQLEEISATEV